MHPKEMEAAALKVLREAAEIECAQARARCGVIGLMMDVAAHKAPSLRQQPNAQASRRLPNRAERRRAARARRHH
jgi:hypothetical protein